jgi:hypothetical protein
MIQKELWASDMGVTFLQVVIGRYLPIEIQNGAGMSRGKAGVRKGVAED